MKRKQTIVLTTVITGSAPVAVALALAGAGAAMAQTGSLNDFAGKLADQPAAAIIYTAREFITMDPKRPRAAAIAVRGGRFVAVGTRAEVTAAVGKDARVDDTLREIRRPRTVGRRGGRRWRSTARCRRATREAHRSAPR